ncbi:GNAT family N-acetyltransferase [Sulfitobacter guttiformis]|nr:GNAT family N-acetyltransferase [Sulfitobacter guttiformis]
MIRDTTATFTTILKTDEDLAALLVQRERAFLIAEVANGCAGFITWGPFRAGPGYAHTAEHSIITAHPGTGVGSALMAAAIDEARAQGIHVMIACIGSENPGAIAFHRRMGFALAGQLPQVGRKSERWHDLIVMSRIIADP